MPIENLISDERANGLCMAVPVISIGNYLDIFHIALINLIFTLTCLSSRDMFQQVGTYLKGASSSKVLV